MEGGWYLLCLYLWFSCTLCGFPFPCLSVGFLIYLGTTFFNIIMKLLLAILWFSKGLEIFIAKFISLLGYWAMTSYTQTLFPWVLIHYETIYTHTLVFKGTGTLWDHLPTHWFSWVLEQISWILVHFETIYTYTFVFLGTGTLWSFSRWLFSSCLPTLLYGHRWHSSLFWVPVWYSMCFYKNHNNSSIP